MYQLTSVFLFGAGASIDAGLSDAFSLTEKIHRALSQPRNKAAARVFGVIIAKVLTKKVRQGASPFDRVNVEEVYDVLQKLASKDSDLLSDFVASWDPLVDDLRSPIREDDVRDAMQSVLNSQRLDRWGSHEKIEIARGGASKLTEILENCRSSAKSTDLSSVERSLLSALVSCLRHDSDRISYFTEIVELAKKYGGDIATLNYDLIAENAATNLGFTYDYGLDSWNSEKIVKFKRSSQSSVRIIKLHGSLNWFSRDDDITVKDDENREWVLPNLVFGGASGKLRINGPFLQLRHEFLTRLLSTNMLVIVGYSFQDEHLNSIIRRWTGTRRKARLIVVDPGELRRFAGEIGQPYTKAEAGQRGQLTVDLNHIKMGAAKSIGKLADLLASPINLERESRNGLLPHIHFNVHE